MPRDLNRSRPGRPRGAAGAGKQAVEIRRVRGSLELRVDGTLASVQRAGGSLTGPVWWALASPVLLSRHHRPAVLVLGLAAGSVARALRALSPGARIVGVEYDAGVLRAARQHFGLDQLGVEVVHGDALAYLRRSRRLFDLVIEDVFLGPARTVRKPDWLLPQGYPLIRRRLRPQGMVVSNTIHETPAVLRACRRFGGRLLCLDVHGHWNRIVVWGRALPSAGEARRWLSREPAMRRALRQLSVRAIRD